MYNLAKVKLYLIKGGFDRDVVLSLPNIFIQEYLEKDYDKLSELLDVFIEPILAIFLVCMIKIQN